MSRISDVDKFISKLEALGGSAGNKSLREQLTWSEEKYWKIRKQLVDNGSIKIGAGYGGSVQLIQNTKQAKEEELYKPLRDAIHQGWDKGGWNADELAIEVTARIGKKSLGRWSQPDLCAISRRIYKFLAHKHIDLWTFEIKPRGEMRVDHVLEAVAHSRFAHRSYIMFHIEDDSNLYGSSFNQCLAEAERHGIGLVTFRNPNKYDHWIWHREAMRKEPNPENLNDFIEQQLPESMQEQILKWLR